MSNKTNIKLASLWKLRAETLRETIELVKENEPLANTLDHYAAGFEQCAQEIIEPPFDLLEKFADNPPRSEKKE